VFTFAGIRTISEEGIAIASMPTFQSAGINGTEFDTPETNRFLGYGDASFSQEILNIAMTQIEAIVQPNCVTNYVGWKSVAFVGVHFLMLTFSASLFGITL
tara:strand:+ start:20126 stop:20428 length:303 start_codon:yes stop_codon:yes gene_type:complete